MKHLNITVISCAFAVAAFQVSAQSFSSGSTGADGALDLTSGDQTVQLPPTGVLNYTTVNIPVGRTLTFQNNVQNTPVFMLAKGNVNIAGGINISGGVPTPGPGGFLGGEFQSNGLGPGGGVYCLGCEGFNGTWVGPTTLVPIVGGSGSAGVCSGSGGSGLGGGGGGAMLIASSAAIVVSGTINASGGDGTYSYCYAFGAAGAIRLVANAITVSGNLTASIARLEAPLAALNYTGSGVVPVRSTINPEIFPTHPPALSIVSIGGYPVPSYSGSSFSTVDLELPTQLSDPIAVVVQATNVPPGSPVTIIFSGSNATASAATLSGSSAASSATVLVSGLNRSAVTYLYVSATFNPALISENIPQTGPDAVSKVEVASGLDHKTSYRFLRKDGTEISQTKVPFELRRLLGVGSSR